MINLNLKVLYSMIAVLGVVALGAMVVSASLMWREATRMIEPEPLVNPISFEQYITAKIERLEKNQDCFNKRMADSPELKTYFPCVDVSEDQINIIEKYEMWEELH